jgi:hypothetical protein
MSILVHCACGREFQVHDRHAGRRLTCPSCHESVLIPGEVPKGSDAGEDGWNDPPLASTAQPLGKRSGKRSPWGVAILLLFLIAVGVSLALCWRQLRSWMGGSSSFPQELALVSPDAHGFISLRVADWWRSPSGQAVREEINRKNPELIKLCEENLGLPPEEIERVIFVMGRGGGDDPDWAIVARTKPKPSSHPRARMEWLFPLGKRQAYYVNDRIFVVGGPVTIQRLQTQPLLKASGPLSDTLRLATEDHLLVCGVSQPGRNLPYLSRKGEVLKDALELFERTSQDCKSAALTASEGDGIQWELRLTFHDEGQAMSFSHAAKSLLALRDFLPRIPLPEAQKVLDSALQNLTLECEGALVRVKAKTDREGVAALLVAGLERLQQIESPPVIVPQDW